MAFPNLPKELRALVFALLDRESLLRFSRTSKDFRGFAEEYMYQDLSFENHNAKRIRRMLLLLLARPELVENIRSVSFGPRSTWSFLESIAPDSWDELQGRFGAIQAAVSNTLAASSDNAQHSMLWLSSIISSADNMDKRCASATFSLIASIAKQLQSISFTLHDSDVGAILYEIINSARTDCFSELRFLRYETHAKLSVRIIPSLEVLDINGSSRLDMRLMGKPCAYKLSTLRITNACFQFAVVSAFCRNGKLPFLKMLAINECKKPMFDEDTQEEVEEVEELITALRDNCPRLVHFEALMWYRYSFRPRRKVMSGLHQLTSLQTLVISGDQLVDVENEEMSLFSTDHLPPNITSLTLDSINMADFATFSRQLQGDLTGQPSLPQDDLGAPAARARAIQRILDSVSATRVKTLTVTEGRMLEPGTKHFLRDLSTRLRAAGVEFRVRDRDDDDALVDKPYLGPCFTLDIE